MCPLVSSVVQPVPLNQFQAGLSWSVWHADVASCKSNKLSLVLLRLFLWLGSLLYALAMLLRNICFNIGLFKTKKVSVPVICIGNLTVGGTGKTPCVEWLCNYLRTLDLRIAILSRGYGGAGGANDEAMVLEDQLPEVPHLQSTNRYLIANSAIEELESELLVLDDGFQHRQLFRDLDIVLIDATNPWGFGYLLPRGTLRESSSGLKRAGAVIITRTNQVEENALSLIRNKIKKLAPEIVLCETIHLPAELIRWGKEPLELTAIKGRKVFAFCGIGNPTSFLKTLADLGAQVVSSRFFPDHHSYSRQDINGLIESADLVADADALLVTTHKDLVKIRAASLGSIPLFALRIEMQFLQGAENLKTLVQTKCFGSIQAGH